MLDVVKVNLELALVRYGPLGGLFFRNKPHGPALDWTKDTKV